MLKRSANLRAGGTPTVDDPSMWDDEVGTEWIAISDMTRSPIVLEGTRRVSELGMAAKRLPVGRPGTVLFAMYASLGAVAVLATNATWNQAILGIEGRTGIADNRFIAYWLEHLARDLGALARSNTQDNLNAEQVGNLPFPAITVVQQREIADFLDVETTRIDALVAKKRRMIQVLRERLRASIDGAIDGSHSRRVRSHLVCRFVRGLSTSQVELNNEGLGVRYLRTSDLIEGLQFSKFDDRYCEHPPAEAVWKCEGELALTIEGFVRPDGSTIGVACWQGEGLLNNHAVVVRPRDERVDARFAQYAHATTDVADVLRASAVGAIALSAGTALRDLVMPLPPLQTQRHIADELDAERQRVDAIVGLEGRMIELLREHRQALITAAVTGQLDVARAAA